MLWITIILFSILEFIPHSLEDGRIFRKQGQDILQEMLAKTKNDEVAKNIVLIIGGGMNFATIAAARILKGQKAERTGIGESLVFENFPSVGLARTYSSDKYVPDASSAATAMLCGLKNKYETVAVDDRVRSGDCLTQRGTEVRCIGEWALAEGKALGLVTNLRVTHGVSPALYAHSVDRWWEYDAKIPQTDRPLCKDIARQLVEDYPGRNFNVILGGGRESFMPRNTFDPEYPEKRGKRLDNRKLIDIWQNRSVERGMSHRYVWNKNQFDAVDCDITDHLLGLFGPSHLYDVTDRDRTDLSDFQEPTLAEMTAKAIKILEKGPNGFFLLVEAGLIDKRHHSGRAVRAVSEALDLENTVQVVLNMTSDNETLLIVTSDHSQSMQFVGYASVGENIFGAAGVSNADHKPYTTLLYATGPGRNKNERQNITGVNTADKDYIQQSAVLLSTSTHSGEDVAVYATGPMSHLFSGVYDQHYIAHAMAYAACIGSNKDHCVSKNLNNEAGFSGTMRNNLFVNIVVILFSLISLLVPCN